MDKINQCNNADPVEMKSDVNYHLVPELEDSLNQMLLGDLEGLLQIEVGFEN